MLEMLLKYNNNNLLRIVLQPMSHLPDSRPGSEPLWKPEVHSFSSPFSLTNKWHFTVINFFCTLLTVCNIREMSIYSDHILELLWVHVSLLHISFEGRNTVVWLALLNNPGVIFFSIRLEEVCDVLAVTV